MPSQHFRCPNCGTLDLITYSASDVGERGWPPTCSTPECFDHRMEQAPQPGDFAIDAKALGQQSIVHRLVPSKDGLIQQREVVDSVHKMRQIEKDSEQRYINGEGEPLRFRALNQSASNMDQNSFGDSGTIGGRSYSSGEAPTKKSNIDVKRHGGEKPKVKVARHAGQSALKGR